MKLYVTTFRDPSNDDFWTEPYMADNWEHAEEQCKDANPPNIDIINTSLIPFYMVERAYHTWVGPK
jgi:hypothetical protein